MCFIQSGLLFGVSVVAVLLVSVASGCVQDMYKATPVLGSSQATVTREEMWPRLCSEGELLCFSTSAECKTFYCHQGSGQHLFLSEETLAGGAQ